MHHSRGRHVDVEPSGDDLPFDRVLGRDLEPSQSRVDDGGGDRTFRGLLIGYLGFSRKTVFIGERAILVEARGLLTRGGVSGGRPMPPLIRLKRIYNF